MAKKKQSINLPDTLYEWIRAKADEHGISVTAEINIVLSEQMKSERGTSNSRIETGGAERARDAG